MSKRIRTRANATRKDISLMTLLANEATSDARKLLKKYGNQDAADYNDLEVKLANLYFQSNDKLGLEKEMAEIHPHKKWLLKYIQPVVKKEEVKVEVKPEEKKSNTDGSVNDNFPMYNPYLMFNGQQKSNTIDYMGIIGVVGVIGVLFFVISKQK